MLLLLENKAENRAGVRQEDLSSLWQALLKSGAAHQNCSRGIPSIICIALFVFCLFFIIGSVTVTRSFRLLDGQSRSVCWSDRPGHRGKLHFQFLSLIVLSIVWSICLPRKLKTLSVSTARKNFMTTGSSETTTSNLYRWIEDRIAI